MLGKLAEWSEELELEADLSWADGGEQGALGLHRGINSFLREITRELCKLAPGLTELVVKTFNVNSLSLSEFYNERLNEHAALGEGRFWC